MLTDDQVPARFKSVFDQQLAVYRAGTSIEVRNTIPDTNAIPIENPRHWLRIPDVICTFVDMQGSTQLSAATHDRSTAASYQLFTGTAVRLFNEFEAPYIDVRGDGVFALFNSDQSHRALAAVVTFKTFVTEEFKNRIRDRTGLSIGGHYGIDRRTVLVRKLGLKRYGNRTDRQNEVWAGKPVNMASKLASYSSDGELAVSDRYFETLTAPEALRSCGCPNGVVSDLWTRIDVSADPMFDFDSAYRLTSNWCTTHGRDYCEELLAADLN